MKDKLFRDEFSYRVKMMTLMTLEILPKIQIKADKGIWILSYSAENGWR